MTNNNTAKETTMKDVNKMTLKEFAAAIRAGKIEVKPEFSHTPTREEGPWTVATVANSRHCAIGFNPQALPK